MPVTPANASPTAPAKAKTVAGSLALLRRLEWKVNGAVSNLLGGEYRSVFRGRGMEFDQVVKYNFGDDVRDIDWNVTAKLGDAYRKKFIEERELTIILVIEDTLSLQFGSGVRTKRDALFEIASLLMLLASNNRDRVGVIHTYPGGYKLTQPVRGHGMIMRAAADLLSRPVPEFVEGAPVPTPWRIASQLAPPNSMLVWLGDFPPRPQPDGWMLIRQRYQPIAFRVEDPWERDFPVNRAVTTYDPVNRRLVVLDPNSAAHRKAHADWIDEREAAFAKLFPEKQSRMVVAPDDSMIEALVKFFYAHMKARTRR